MRDHASTPGDRHRGRITKKLLVMAISLQAILALIGIRCWVEAGLDPVVVRHDVRLAGFVGPKPLRIAFLTDTHVSGDFAGSRIDPARLSRIVAQVNALAPDLVVLGGDYITGRAGKDNPVSFRDSVAPFKGLKARLGVYGVLGNHDYERGDHRRKLTSWLRHAGVTPLVNESIQLAGITLAGVDDLWFGQADPRFLSGLSTSTRPVVLISHNPDIFPSVPRSIQLTLSGHTHGAQIVPPIIGPIVSTSRYGQRYRRDLVQEDGHSLIVSSGIGGRPFKWNVPPEILLVELRGQNHAS